MNDSSDRLCSRLSVFVVCALVTLFSSARTHAEDNTTLSIVGPATTNIGGTLIIGDSGTNNSLQISNGGSVTNTDAIIGFQTGANNNFALITDANSLWYSSDNLTVGYNGHANRLTITNGGDVISLNGYIGGHFPAASSGASNIVIVTGTGSTWSNTVTSGNNGLFVGSRGGANQLIISDGGRVDSFHGFVGFFSTISDNNTVLVTGADSLLNLKGVFYAGSSSQGNQVTISNGGRIVNAQFGGVGVGSTSSNNLMIVTGTGSVWSNVTDVGVGVEGSYNRLQIENGGRVESLTGYIGGSPGNAPTGNSNTVVVTGTGSVWNNSSDLTVGFSGIGNQLIITNGGDVISFNGEIGGDPSTGGANGSRSTVIVTGTGSTWSNTVTSGNAGLFVGSRGGNNQLIISDGGRVDSFHMFMGQFSISPSNSILVTGTDSLLNLRGGFFAGSGSEGNTVTISDGGRVINAGTGLLGSGTGASNNVILVTGTGSVWSNAATLFVADEASHNRLQIENGGQVHNGEGIIGNTTLARSNTVIVTGAGSLWNNTDDLTVGYNGAGDRLIITNGGRVVSLNGNVGSKHTTTTFGSNSTVIVTGAGSTWSNTASGSFAGLTLGTRGGGGNQMVISDGGRVDANWVLLGRFSGNNNSVLVTGSNSLLNTSSTGLLLVGFGGTGQQLTISNGGTASAFDTRIGSATTASGRILVTGQGSMLRNGARLAVGNNGVYTEGSGSALVTDDGTIELQEMYAGTGGAISNVSGVYQFTTSTPTVTPGAGIIMMTNGTISYRGVTGANINNAQVGNISKAGNNAFRLNNSSNAAVASYTFDAIANTDNPTNYQRLALINNSRWTSANLTIGTGGGLTGAAGDVVEITQNFTINRNVNTGGEFDLASSAVLFSGNTGHTNAITGDDFGNNGTVGYDGGFTAENFAYGKLSLGSASDTICFQCGETPVAASNALYVTWLDLLGNANLVTNLHSSSTINIYYMLGEPNNAYLNNAVYQLTDCNGGVGGLLMPAVPEPSVMALLGLGASLLCRRARRNG